LRSIHLETIQGRGANEAHRTLYELKIVQVT
jgi:hypothetical protein